MIMLDISFVNQLKSKPLFKPVLTAFVFLLALLLICFLIFLNQTQKEIFEPPVTLEEIINREIKEINELREKTNYQPLTQEEIKKQIKELDTLHSKVTLPSQEKTSKQLEELDELRQSQ